MGVPELAPPVSTAMVPPHPELDSRVDLQDAILALLLAAKIHGTDSAIKATAKRCAKQIPRSKRGILFNIATSSAPLKLVHQIAENLD